MVGYLSGTEYYTATIMQSRNTQNDNILRFLFVFSLTSNLLVGGLGVEYLLNDPPAKGRSYCMWCWDKQKSCKSKQTKLDDVKQHIRYILPPFLLTSLR